MKRQDLGSKSKLVGAQGPRDEILNPLKMHKSEGIPAHGGAGLHVSAFRHKVLVVAFRHDFGVSSELLYWQLE